MTRFPDLPCACGPVATQCGSTITGTEQLQRRISIGSATALTATAARDQATKLYAQVKLGADPAGQRFASSARAGETFGAAAEAYWHGNDNACALPALSRSSTT